ncbi:MAG: hypothetical protein ACRENP_05465 [Longimicrobiales bacterium]
MTHFSQQDTRAAVPHEDGQKGVLERERASLAVTFQKVEYALHELRIGQTLTDLGDQFAQALVEPSIRFAVGLTRAIGRIGVDEAPRVASRVRGLLRCGAVRYGAPICEKLQTAVKH